MEGTTTKMVKKGTNVPEEQHTNIHIRFMAMKRAMQKHPWFKTLGEDKVYANIGLDQIRRTVEEEFCDHGILHDITYTEEYIDVPDTRDIRCIMKGHLNIFTPEEPDRMMRFQTSADVRKDDNASSAAMAMLMKNAYKVMFNIGERNVDDDIDGNPPRGDKPAKKPKSATVDNKHATITQTGVRPPKSNWKQSSDAESMMRAIVEMEVKSKDVERAVNEYCKVRGKMFLNELTEDELATLLEVLE